MLATMMLSLGVPMLLGGDELSHTQHGNNNAYCQDNNMTWFQWQCFFDSHMTATGQQEELIVASTPSSSSSSAASAESSADFLDLVRQLLRIIVAKRIDRLRSLAIACYCFSRLSMPR
jgi:isoamylase